MMALALRATARGRPLPPALALRATARGRPLPPHIIFPTRPPPGRYPPPFTQFLYMCGHGNIMVVHGFEPVTSCTIQSRFGNWSIEVGGTAQTWTRGSSIALQARVDRKEKVWLNGTIIGRCLQTTAGFMNGVGRPEDIRVSVCVGREHSVSVLVEQSDRSNAAPPLVSVSVEPANQRLALKAHGCVESFISLEAQVEYWSSQMKAKLREKVKALQYLLNEFRRQSQESAFAQHYSTVCLSALGRLEALLSSVAFVGWHRSTSRRFLTENVPQFVSLLQHASLLGQHELRRPLATLAAVYQDVRGQRLEAQWGEAVSMWTESVGEMVTVHNHQFLSLLQLCGTAVRITGDVVGQQSYQWLESRLALALSGVRKRLSSVYRFSPRECSVSISVPLPRLHWPGTDKSDLVQGVLEEWLFRPLQSLASIRPAAEFYRLKRRTMDSPFTYQALLVSDLFVVTYDGHILELPHSCPLLLAHSLTAHPSFSLMLNPDSSSFVLIKMNNHSISIQQNGQVRVDCHSLVSNTFLFDGVSVERTAKVVEVTNQNGVSVSCDLWTELCSLTLDGWLHGTSAGLMGTNDNEAGNDLILPNGSYAANHRSLIYSWKMSPECSEAPVLKGQSVSTVIAPLSCEHLFSSLDSPLSVCFRVVDPSAFLSVCRSSPRRAAACHLASAFSHVCNQNYVPLETPVQCRLQLRRGHTHSS
ncbi:uncharacterized protein LOC129456890 [Periophthalmus magnuspinnatus]|uniref:uncharacterized protein LOC129456890 n=1 Tax=Periophthalmus magnuspinnatus TaxID=409849 RepID=UPI0024372739|nr:uncharacterized protein LOC129456890 [Periophthalmus magnuspinnatus]